MAIPKIINKDVACQNCGYNLRGLTLEHRCPECGTPAGDSVRLVLHRKRQYTPEAEAARRKKWDAIKKAVDKSGYTFEAFRFMRDVLYFANQAKRDDPRVHVDAQMVCNVLREYAVAHFGGQDAAILHLSEIGLKRSEDVGRVLFSMVEHGILRVEEGDSEDSFRDLFTLSSLYPS